MVVTVDDRSRVTPVKRSRISQQIVVQLCQMIRSQQVRPGDRLPPERELVELFQVSRGSLREALRALEIAGVIDARQGGGTYVRETFDVGMLSPLALVLDTGSDLIGSLWEVRMIFEPEIASRAALRAEPPDIDAIDAVVRQQERFLAGTESDEAWLDSDHAFHDAVARAAHNEVAVRVVGLINDLLSDGRRHFGATERRRQHAYLAHQNILSAIRSQQPASAHDAMLGHLRSVEEFIVESVVGGDLSSAGAPAFQ
jgi:GntR family transcriptional regulator, transcriptional repressor for pyruvate dehydrogenase complex